MPDEEKKTVDIDTSGPGAEVDLPEDTAKKQTPRRKLLNPRKKKQRPRNKYK